MQAAKSWVIVLVFHILCVKVSTKEWVCRPEMVAPHSAINSGLILGSKELT